MGCGDCGTDSKGRPIGYGFPARCDHVGCGVKIDRGLAYACGGMHGEDEYSCEGYFCPRHLTLVRFADGHLASICAACEAHAREHKLLAEGE